MKKSFNAGAPLPSFMVVALALAVVTMGPWVTNGFAREEHHKHEHHVHPEYATIENPVAKAARSIAEGRKLYEKNCTACHGAAGKGGVGPDLTGPIRIHGNSDGEMFHVITDGVPGTAMKGFKNELSDEMRWHLVNYLTSLRNTQGK